LYLLPTLPFPPQLLPSFILSLLSSASLTGSVD
jgi:hypothetical protein